LGLDVRKVALKFETMVYLVPLFGHTLGHCGVAISEGERWIFYVGDAYYLRAELSNENHPITELAALRAEDNSQRLKSLDKIKNVFRKHAGTVEVFGYHDPSEFPVNNNNSVLNFTQKKTTPPNDL
jgi:glyoxylase-like metal-dependent hydrolase (beta-lactamase superfamily II)